MFENSFLFYPPMNKMQKIAEFHPQTPNFIYKPQETPKNFREVLKDQWKSECLHKKRTLTNFLLVSQNTKNLNELMENIKMNYKVTSLLAKNWLNEYELIELFNKNMSRYNFLL